MATDNLPQKRKAILEAAMKKQEAIEQYILEIAENSPFNAARGIRLNRNATINLSRVRDEILKDVRKWKLGGIIKIVDINRILRRNYKVG